MIDIKIYVDSDEELAKWLSEIPDEEEVLASVIIGDNAVDFLICPKLDEEGDSYIGYKVEFMAKHSHDELWATIDADDVVDPDWGKAETLSDFARMITETGVSLLTAAY